MVSSVNSVSITKFLNSLSVGELKPLHQTISIKKIKEFRDKNFSGLTRHSKCNRKANTNLQLLELSYIQLTGTWPKIQFCTLLNNVIGARYTVLIHANPKR